MINKSSQFKFLVFYLPVLLILTCLLSCRNKHIDKDTGIKDTITVKVKHDTVYPDIPAPVEVKKSKVKKEEIIK
jgi:hypothetical protein